MCILMMVGEVILIILKIGVILMIPEIAVITRMKKMNILMTTVIAKRVIILIIKSITKGIKKKYMRISTSLKIKSQLKKNPHKHKSHKKKSKNPTENRKDHPNQTKGKNIMINMTTMITKISIIV